MESPYLDCIALFGVGGAHPGGLQLTKKILTKEKIRETTAILDVGCGTGQTSAYIAKQYGCNVTALDCDKIMLEKAKQRFESLRLPIDVRKGSAESLPFDDGSFDIVLSESVTAFTDVSRTVPEFRRVLKKDGVMLAIEAVIEKSVSEEELAPFLHFYGMSGLLTEHEWLNLFQKANFKNINVERYKVQIDEQDVDNAADFSLSEDIGSESYEALEKHFHYSMFYKDILGYRVFRCSC
ncbi:class I SAM-dependent methyltransferase [Niallia oryzisoli]|uniref:Class I SAM-dependent methyltransferase n=1 Tax=Niallia oryzisoli TaxID=1737571 RepID=A0ABZ2CJU1_9BACI